MGQRKEVSKDDKKRHTPQYNYKNYEEIFLGICLVAVKRKRNEEGDEPWRAWAGAGDWWGSALPLAGGHDQDLGFLAGSGLAGVYLITKGNQCCKNQRQAGRACSEDGQRDTPWVMPTLVGCS